MQKYCMYIYTYTLIIWVNRRDNFYYVSKSINCKLCNDPQYVDIVFITLCFYQVDRVQNTLHFYVSISTLLLSVYIFSIHFMLHIWHYCDLHLMVKWYSVLLYEQNCTKVIGTNWIVSFEGNIVLSMKANCCLADVQ